LNTIIHIALFNHFANKFSSHTLFNIASSKSIVGNKKKHLKNNNKGKIYKAINQNKLKEFSKSGIQQHYKSNKYKKYRLQIQQT
jgi:hypothetical protein